tara:strand:- start:44 stop:292 length:249 start_codon:yes stop_codon:yes gene_type:complete
MNYSGLASVTVNRYKVMQAHGSMATTSMLNDVERQYIDMAQGGDGGQLDGFDHGTTCRSYNYNGYPNSFFQQVCKEMGWLGC